MQKKRYKASRGRGNRLMVGGLKRRQLGEAIVNKLGKKGVDWGVLKKSHHQDIVQRRKERQYEPQWQKDLQKDTKPRKNTRHRGKKKAGPKK